VCSCVDRTVYGAASASASSFVVHHTQQISMAAVAGDAENINKQARNTRINWLNSPERANWVNDVKNKQAADVLLPSAPVEGARTRTAALSLAPRVPRTGPSTLYVRIM